MKAHLFPLLAAGVLAYGTPARADSFSSIGSNFNGTAIPAGDSVWFNSVLKPSGLSTTGPTTFSFTNQTITSGNFSLSVPNATVTFDPSVTKATTTYNAATNTWNTVAPASGLAGNTFLSGAALKVPAGGLPGGINPVTWSGDFTTNTPGASLNWQWAAATYTPNFSSDLNSLGVKPVDDNSASDYLNSDKAGTPENFTDAKDQNGGARGGGGSNFTGSLSPTGSVTFPPQTVPEPASIILLGLGAFGFGGFLARRQRRVLPA